MISICAKSDVHGTANSFVLDKTVGHNAVDVVDTIVSHQLVRPLTPFSMLHAPTLQTVFETLRPSFVQQRLKIDSPSEPKYSFFRPGDMYERVPLTDKVKLVGLLFMHPDSDIAKKDVIPRFGLYHERAGEFTDFFFAGYGAYWPTSEYPDQRPVMQLDGTQWLFSDRAFNRFRHELQAKTKWQYSGETDLILATARYFPEHRKADLDFSECITCCLEQLLRDGATASTPALFERIFHFGETKKDATAYDFSDLHFIRTSKLSLLEWLLTRLGLKDYYNRNKGMAIHDISKAA